MSPTKQKHRTSSGARTSWSNNSIPTTTMTTVEWISEVINSGSLHHVDLHTGTNGWASPPSDLFSFRSKNYLTKWTKSPSDDYLLVPTEMDWLKSSTKVNNVLTCSDNRVAHALRKAQSQGQSLKSFILVVNLQIPSKDHHNAVFYFATEDHIPFGSLLHRSWTKSSKAR